MRIESDYSDVFEEFDRLKSLPTPAVAAHLNRVLTEYQRQIVEEDVHKDTYSLALSAKSKSSTNKVTHTWTGTISLGGTSMGPIKRVTYAMYEMRRGGTHNFYHNSWVFEYEMRAAMRLILKGWVR